MYAVNFVNSIILKYKMFALKMSKVASRQQYAAYAISMVILTKFKIQSSAWKWSGQKQNSA